MRRQWGRWLSLTIGLWQLWESPGAASGAIFQEQIDMRSVRIVRSSAVA